MQVNRQQRRAQQRSPLPPRPQMISEQLREQINANIGKGRRVMNRDECAQFTVMLASNLERLLNSNDQLPWITSSIEKRANGFTIHVDLIEPTDRSDLVV